MSVLLCLLVAAAPAIDSARIVADAVVAGERVWARVEAREPTLASRDLFGYALALCEAEQHPERLGPLLELAATMQDRHEASRGYGNFRWRLAELEVLDFNAVDFCMLPGSLLWLRHAERLDAPVRATLRELLEYGGEGCRRHGVSPSYTNIALMNAACLILLGEGLDQADLADEGYRRFEQVGLYTWRYGTHEYDSPTYSGVDSEVLLIIEQFAGRETGRAQAAAMLDLLWTDVALNWFAPSRRLGGSRSRDYDYLRGHGMLDAQAAAFGLAAEPGPLPLAFAFCGWRPREIATRLPRTVRQSWGPTLGEAKTHYLTGAVSLGSSAAGYRDMDLPLTVDLAGPPEQVRGYFLPDGRRDPYGTGRVPAGPHQKSLHLYPFWTAAQRGPDAVALVVYRPSDIPDGTATLESHFVLPRGADEIWVGNRPVSLGEAGVQPVAIGEPVTLRYGAAAVAIRVPWARDRQGRPASVALVDDGNPHGALRLTIMHHDPWGLAAREDYPGALLWLRVAELPADEGFAAFRREFAGAAAELSTEEGVSLRVAGVEGPVAVAAEPPYRGPLSLDPLPTRAVLAVDGEEIGRPILERAEPMASASLATTAAPLVELPLTGGLTLEAEAGMLLGALEPGADALASGGGFVWQPGEPGARGGGLGSVGWRLRLPAARAIYVWARVKTPTPDDDSYFVRVAGETSEPLSQVDWHLGVHADWAWVPLALETTGATPVRLAAGETLLELSVREDGAMLDCLYLTTDPESVPR